VDALALDGRATLAPGGDSADERALVARIRAGDAAAFEALFRSCVGPLTAFVFRIVRSRDVARDIVQDLFCGLWADRAHWEVRESARGYLYAAAHRRALNGLRHDMIAERSHSRFAAHRQSPAMGAAPIRADALAEGADLVAALERALAEVPPRAREVARLRWVDQLRRSEIATALGISVKTVDAHLQTAAGVVRTQLRGRWP
jgi:RNA polymerase sigma-70 factor (ECF subfamily)